MKGIKKDFEYVKNFIEKNNCILMQDYYDAKHKLKIKCKCGKYFETKFCNFENNNQRQCPDCGKQKRIKSNLKNEDEIIDELNKNNCKLIGNYIKSSEKILIECNCGEIFSTTISNLRAKKYKCNKCNIKRKNCKNSEEYIIDFIKQNNCELVSKYINNRNKIKIKCSCGNIFETSFKSFKRNKRRCNKCTKSISAPELNTMKILDDNKLIYILQYKFDDCIDKSKLLFDFAIVDDKNNILFLLEIDGEYHYHPIISKEHLESQKRRDNIKNEYCKNNNIRLLRIPYWDFDKIDLLIKDFVKI